MFKSPKNLLSYKWQEVWSSPFAHNARLKRTNTKMYGLSVDDHFQLILLPTVLDRPNRPPSVAMPEGIKMLLHVPHSAGTDKGWLTAFGPAAYPQSSAEVQHLHLSSIFDANRGVTRGRKVGLSYWGPVWRGPSNFSYWKIADFEKSWKCAQIFEYMYFLSEHL